MDKNKSNLKIQLIKFDNNNLKQTKIIIRHGYE